MTIDTATSDQGVINRKLIRKINVCNQNSLSCYDLITIEQTDLQGLDLSVYSFGHGQEVILEKSHEKNGWDNDVSTGLEGTAASNIIVFISNINGFSYFYGGSSIVNVSSSST